MEPYHGEAFVCQTIFQTLAQGRTHDFACLWHVVECGQSDGSLQTPIAFNADPAVAWAVSNGMLNAYITEPQIFMQEVQASPRYLHLYGEENSNHTALNNPNE